MSIQVNVVEFSSRRFYMAQWKDPKTGKVCTRSTKVERTALKKSRHEAERVAAQLERQLNDGKYKPTSKITWNEFVERYENEVAAGQAKNTAIKVGTVSNWIDRLMAPKHLRELTTETISEWQAKLRDHGCEPATIASHSRHLRAMLSWAVEIGFLPVMPKIRVGRTVGARGRAPTGEELDRIVAAVDRVRTVKPSERPLWRRFIEGLWWSGLRISEAVALSWEPTAAVAVIMLPDHHPFLRFRPEGQKSGRAEDVPMAPEFAGMLEDVPAHERSGRVFELPGEDSGWIGRVISRIGKAAGVIVAENPRKGTTKHATAQDFRRAFGTRWARRVMPVVLKSLMRHKDINTTLQYYVTQTVEDVSTVVWESYRRERSANTLTNTRVENPLI